MRIVQYLFLIAVLLLFGGAVFILTENPSFDLECSRQWKCSSQSTAEILSEPRYWDLFMDWPSAQPETASQSRLQGLFFNHQTAEHPSGLYLCAPSTPQRVWAKAVIDQATTDYQWHITALPKGMVRVTLRAQGKVSFQTRFLAFFNGGVQAFVREKLNNSVAQLQQTLYREWGRFRVQKGAFVKFNAQQGLARTVRVPKGEWPKAIQQTVIRLRQLQKNNRLKATAPYCLRLGLTSNDLKCTVGIPMSKPVYPSDPSDVHAFQIPAFFAYRVRMQGHYRFISNALRNAQQQAQAEGYYPNRNTQPILMLQRDAQQSARPSSWITDVYWPVYPKSRPRVAPAMPTTVADSTSAAPTF